MSSPIYLEGEHDPKFFLKASGNQLILSNYYKGKVRRYKISATNGVVSPVGRHTFKGKPAAVVSIYESVTGTVDVFVKRSAPPNLILAAYDPVTWRIRSERPLQSVIVSGYHKPKVTGLKKGTKVTVLVAEDGDQGLQGEEDVSDRYAVPLNAEKLGYATKAIASGYSISMVTIK